jgi:sterol 3beta-glucosyltransferase
MRALLLTVGTRGDVQPFVALGTGLARAGHDVTLCTTSNFAPFVEQHGLRYAYLNPELVELTTGDVGRRAVEDFGGGAIGKARWVVEAAKRFKPIFRRLLAEQWAAAQGAEVVVFHPNAVGGVHLAEALGVPGVMADPMPTWVPTGEFPNFVFPDPGFGASYNRLTYRLLPLLTRGMYGSVVARWRRETLGLSRRSAFASDFVTTDGRTLPVLQAFSRHVVPRPSDWPDSAVVTGYWFLDEGVDWTPPRELADFLDAGPPPVFVGFGSMAGRDPARTARTVLAAVARSGQRALIVSGWGGLRVDEPPPGVFVAESEPTVVCPFVADQPFWGARVAALGVGPRPIPQRRLGEAELAAAILEAVGDAGMRDRAERLGAQIRAEDGVAAAVEVIGGQR